MIERPKMIINLIDKVYDKVDNKAVIYTGKEHI